MDSFWIIAVGILVSLNGSLIGSFLVLRKSTMMGDAISHAVLPGIVISYLITHSISSITMVLGATISGVVAILIIGFFNKTAKLQIDASIGVVFTFLFAIGTVFITFFTRKADLDQECVLFGEILYVPLNLWIMKNGVILGPKSFYILLFVLLLNLTFIGLFNRQLKITTFDEGFASAIGIRSILWNYLILTATALTTVAAFESVGTILIIAFLAIPSSAAFLLSKSVKDMLVISAIFGVISAVVGYYCALYTNTSISAWMAMISSCIFAICFLLKTLCKIS